MAVDGTHGVGRVLDALSVYDRLGCDVVDLQETRRSTHSVFTQAGYTVLMDTNARTGRREKE